MEQKGKGEAGFKVHLAGQFCRKAPSAFLTAPETAHSCGSVPKCWLSVALLVAEVHIRMLTEHAT